jgi:dihydropyrimidinase
MKHFLSSEDVREALRDGKKEIRVSEEMVVTDVAAEMARNASMKIVREKVSEKIRAGAAGAPQGQGVYDLLLAGGSVVLPEVGVLQVNVAISGGKIAALTLDQPGARRTVDLSGKYALPGIIDPHIHLGLFVPLEKELRTETRAALIGGVTTAGCFFNQPESYLSLLGRLAEKTPGISHIDILPHLTLRESAHLDELPSYRKAGVRSFKMYMCGIPGILPSQDDAFILKAMRRVASLAPDALLCVHAENSSIVGDGEREFMENPECAATLENWASSHPEISEEEAALRAALFAERSGVRLYLVHIGTESALRALAGLSSQRGAKGEKRVFVETTSPYLTLYCDGGGAGSQSVRLKMTPPVRSRETAGALWKALEEGIIDTIGTDNTTLTSVEKSGGVRNALPGYPALGTHLASVLHEGVTKRGLPIEKIVPLMTLNPARILGLYPRKGTLLPGSDADVTVVDMRAERRVVASELTGRSDFALHEGEILRGWPVMTVKDGVIVAQDGCLTGAGVVARGHLLRA